MLESLGVRRIDGANVNRSPKPIVFGVGALALLLIGISGVFRSNAIGADQPKPGSSAEASDSDAALARTRKQIRMLDDIYKGSIVTITQNYVNDKDMIPAGTAFKQLFAAVEEKGWHKVRLLDATGEPLNDENIPEEGFESEAIKQLLAGKNWYEKTIDHEGKRYMQVATPIPVVFEKCIMCHDAYADLPKGKPIGALAYTVPIE